MSITTWNIDTAHTGISFSVRHMVVSKVRGRFAKYSGTLRIDEDDMTRSGVEVNIDAASLDTGVPERDTHLRSPDFFDAEKFPQLHFRSKRIEKVEDARYRLVGDLTIRDVTRDNERIGFVAKGFVDRKDFGLKWNQALEAGGVVLGDRVDIDLDLEAVRVAARGAA